MGIGRIGLMGQVHHRTMGRRQAGRLRSQGAPSQPWVSGPKGRAALGYASPRI
jgi:hypothetical protein